MRIFETDNYVRTQSVCEDALAKLRMHTIIGYPGAGKTVALKSFARKRDLAYYLRVKKSMETKDFYMEILKSMGVINQDRSVSLFNLIRKIVWMLNESGGKNLLIIDEAGKFKPEQLEYIHELRDETEKSTGIILAGPEYFFDNLTLWKNKSVIGIPEVFRRIHSFVWLDSPKKHEIKAICNNYGIAKPEAVREFYSCSSFSELTNRIVDYVPGKDSGDVHEQ